MGRFSRSRRPTALRSDVGPLLSSSSILDGDPAARRNLIVEGRIQAEVPLHAHGVSIATSGEVVGDIHAAMIRVEGEVTGDLNADVQILVCSTGKVRGDITAPNVVIAEGAAVKGRIRMEDPPRLGARLPTVQPRDPSAY